MKGFILFLSLLVISVNGYSKTSKSVIENKPVTEKALIKKAEDILQKTFLKKDVSGLMNISHYPVKNNQFTEDRLFHHDIELKDALERYLARFTETTREFNEKAKGDKKLKKAGLNEWNAECFKKVKLAKIDNGNSKSYRAFCKPMEFNFELMDDDIYFTGIMNIDN